MKKYVFAVFAVLLCCAIYGCTLSVDKNSQNLTTYSADLILNDQDMTLNGTLKVDYVNNTMTSLNNIKFNIYPNAFREDSSQDVISLAKYAECYYNGASFGNINIKNVNNSSGDLQFEICGKDKNILNVNLNSPLIPTKQVCFNVSFEIKIPNISHRFGYGENVINLGNFLPSACVYEHGNFTEIEYSSNGDPFYSECANYFVNLTCDEKFTLASTGTIVNSTSSGNQKTYNIKALCVRDFAIVLSDKFKVVSDVSENYKVNYYYYNDENFEKSLKTSVLAMKTFSELFGNYPYEEINIVQSNFCIGGMEFPNLVLIGDNISNYETYQYVIVHELAHQWWYGVVGNNQTAHSWLDEGLAEYSTALFYEKNKVYDTTYDLLIKRANSSIEVYQTVYTNVLGEVDTTMTRTLSEFKSENEYVYTAYIKGFLMYDSLASLLSEKVVVKCLKNYFITYAFGVATPSDLIASFEKTTSCNLENFFNSWLNGKVILKP